MQIGAIGYMPKTNVNTNKNVQNTLVRNNTSFGYLVSTKQANWLKYLREKAPLHIAFYNKKIAQNMGKSNSSSAMRDLYMTLAIGEAKLIKGFDTIKTFLTKTFAKNAA